MEGEYLVELFALFFLLSSIVGLNIIIIFNQLFPFPFEILDFPLSFLVVANLFFIFDSIPINFLLVLFESNLFHLGLFGDGAE